MFLSALLLTIYFPFFNVLEMRIKLADFGLSTPFVEGDSLRDFCGSPGFYAPECTTHSPYCGRKADLFSIGCIMFELLCGPVYFRDKWLSTYRHVRAGNTINFRSQVRTAIACAQKLIDARYPPDIARAITAMLNYEPVMRPEIHYLRQRNSWIAHCTSAATRESIARMLHSSGKPGINTQPPHNKVPRGPSKKIVHLKKKAPLPKIFPTA